MEEVFRNSQASKLGVRLHAFAHEAIRLGERLPRDGRTLSRYVNDAIGFRMTTEQIVYYSDNCYGHVDTISFRKKFLRIHDLKTGIIPGSMLQLVIYAALFCLEYGVKPGEIKIELRIYQNNEIIVDNPEVDFIAHVMSKIVVFDRQIEMLKMGGLT